jgi:hypothetical protein
VLLEVKAFGPDGGLIHLDAVKRGFVKPSA